VSTKNDATCSELSYIDRNKSNCEIHTYSVFAYELTSWKLGVLDYISIDFVI